MPVRFVTGTFVQSMFAMIETILLIAYIYHQNDQAEELASGGDENGDTKTCTCKNPFKKISVGTTTAKTTLKEKHKQDDADGQNRGVYS